MELNYFEYKKTIKKKEETQLCTKVEFKITKTGFFIKFRHHNLSKLSNSQILNLQAAEAEEFLRVEVAAGSEEIEFQEELRSTGEEEEVRREKVVAGCQEDPEGN